MSNEYDSKQRQCRWMFCWADWRCYTESMRTKALMKIPLDQFFLKIVDKRLFSHELFDFHYDGE